MSEATELDVLQPMAAPALPAAALDRLPRSELGVPELDDDPFWRLAAAFLVECRRPQTRRACFNDLRARYAWCSGRELHPLEARRHDVALWARQLAERPGRSGKVEAPASIARRLSCLSSFYMATHQHLDRHATYAFAAWAAPHARRRARRRLSRRAGATVATAPGARSRSGASRG